MAEKSVKVRETTGYHIGLLYDTKGPDFRTLEMEENGVEFKYDFVTSK